MEKVALVTGGDRGIGRAISIALAKKGYAVAINYRNNEEMAEETKMTIEKLGSRAITVKFDVSKRDEVENGIKKIIDKFGRIDVLVNNAGIVGKHSKFHEINDEEWDEVINTNLKGAFIVSQEVTKYMKKGKIVNLASIAGRNGGTVGVHYASSKAGIIGLTFALASQLAPDILVTAVAPGPVDTGLLSEEKKKELSKLTPLGRVAKPEEIAHAIVCLIENDYITGAVIDINGGRYML
jgi:3-oxoacyl-[acyl-carrier protein] reductase